MGNCTKMCYVNEEVQQKNGNDEFLIDTGLINGDI